MPSAQISFIKNTAPQFYKTVDYDNATYNAMRRQCGISSPCWCSPAQMDDPLTFQFKAEEVGANLFEPATQVLVSGTNTSVSAGELVDSGASFSALNGSIIRNDATGISTIITGTAPTVLTLQDDIFTASPVGYSVLRWESSTSSDWQYGLSGKICANNAADRLQYDIPMTSNGWYRLTVTITDYVSGSLDVHFGTSLAPVLGQITANGTYTFYGQKFLSTGGIQFIPPVGTSFTGCIDITTIEAYRINETYYIEIVAEDGTVVYSDTFTYSGDGLTIGNIVWNEGPWSTFLIPEGCYTIRIAGNQDGQLSELITNGNFGSTADWTLSAPDITISAGKLRFSSVAQGEYALQDLVGGDLIPGTTYDFSFVISDYISGSVEIFNGPILLATYNTNGTHTFQFTTSTVISPYSQIYLIAGTAGLNTFDIDDVSLKVADADYVFAGQSECICVADQWDCTELLSWQNNEGNNAFGQWYGDPTYFNYLRLPADVGNPTLVPVQYDRHKGSTGFLQMTYADMVRAFEFMLEPVPPWIILAVQQAFVHNIVNVGSTRYVLYGEISPDNQRRELLRSVVFEIAEYDQQNLSNTY